MKWQSVVSQRMNVKLFMDFSTPANYGNPNNSQFHFLEVRIMNNSVFNSRWMTHVVLHTDSTLLHHNQFEFHLYWAIATLTAFEMVVQRQHHQHLWCNKLYSKWLPLAILSLVHQAWWQQMRWFCTIFQYVDLFSCVFSVIWNFSLILKNPWIFFRIRNYIYFQMRTLTVS